MTTEAFETFMIIFTSTVGGGFILKYEVAPRIAEYRSEKPANLKRIEEEFEREYETILKSWEPREYPEWEVEREEKILNLIKNTYCKTKRKYMLSTLRKHHYKEFLRKLEERMNKHVDRYEFLIKYADRFRKVVNH